MYKSSALQLLNDYGSDTDDDEVPGPKVSTKRTFKNEDKSVSNKKRFPVPDFILSKDITENECKDDSNSHNGRIRTFAHERGIWASYVYILFEAHLGIKEIVDYCKDILKNDYNIELFEIDDCHISLTRTVVLRHHWIQSFVESVKNGVNMFKKFVILFSELKVYCNDEKTRTFIGIESKSGYDSLLSIVKMLDCCLTDFRLPMFYENPSFHMSIAWCLGDKKECIQENLAILNKKYNDITMKYPDELWCIFVENIVAKIGNKYFNFNLNA